MANPTVAGLLNMLSSSDGGAKIAPDKTPTSTDKTLSSTFTKKVAATGGGIIGKLRRWNIINDSDDCGPEDKAAESTLVVPKSKETRDMLSAALRENYLFAQLSEDELDHMMDAMKKRDVKAPGETIIKQGDTGSEFYILERGAADVLVNDAKVTEYGPGACFGELALIYNAKRAATIVSTTPCTLWTLDLRTFRRMLATASSSQTMACIEFLRKVPLLANLSNEQISKLAGALSSRSFPDGAAIIRQGDIGDTFYLIKEGTVKCTQNKMGREVELLQLHAGDYFGEMALLLDEPRHANVVAIGLVEVYGLEKENFIKLLGPVRDVISRQMRIRVLKSVPLLSRLADPDLDKVGNVMRVQQFEPNQYVVKEGEPGSRFYIINEGTVKCCKRNAMGKDEEVLRLHDQEYFGERALLREEPRAASVIAVTRVECLVLERSDFNGLLGNLEPVMQQEVKRRENLTPRGETGGVVKKLSGSGKPGGPPSAAEPGGPAAAPVITYAWSDLVILRTLGTGTFGRVKLVQHKPTGRVAALKCMQKAQIVSSHQERNIMNEKNILASCRHPFILEMLATFSDHDRIYMLMELVQGGELWAYVYDRYHLIPRTKFGGFRREHAQFYLGCVISAFEYIHGKSVAYRDLKPENLLMDKTGFIKVIDFGFAKQIPFEKNGVTQTKSFTLCGTPEYLSPELVLSRGHDKSVDYWALGCLVYELLIGRTPFQDDNQNEIFKKIIHSNKYLTFPRNFDADATDIIRKLLAPNPAFRLGNLLGGVREIMDHPFFSTFDWARHLAKQTRPPYVPTIKDPLDVSNFDPLCEDDNVTPYHGAQHIFENF